MKTAFVFGPAAAALWLCSAAPSTQAAEVITGFNPITHQIETFSMTGTLKASFVPTSDVTTCTCGRGVAYAKRGTYARDIYYTEVFSGSANGIHIAPYNLGSGGSDVFTIANPDTRKGAYIQDLDIVGQRLFVMSGYNGQPTEIFRLNANNGNLIGSPVTIQNHPAYDADGFVVLPNGNYLINQGDASNTYCEYSPTTGLPITCPAITLSAAHSTGVDYNVYDQLLYFDTWDSQQSTRTIIATTLTGEVKKTISIPSLLEDIDVHKGP